MTWHQLLLTLLLGWTRGTNTIGCKFSSTLEKHCRHLFKNADYTSGVTSTANPFFMLNLQRNKKSNSKGPSSRTPKCLSTVKTEICSYCPLIHRNFSYFKTRSLHLKPLHCSNKTGHRLHTYRSLKKKCK